MNLLPNRSKEYVAVFLGGHPVNADSAIEIVADKQHRLNFIYGFNIFVVYFYSKKRMEEINNVFLATLKDQVDIIFVFANTKKAMQYMAPSLSIKMEKASSDRNNTIGSDMIAFRNVLTSIGNRMPFMEPVEPVTRIATSMSEDEDRSLSDNDILNELLTKIKKTGYESLSPAELDFFKIYKDKHRKDNQNDQDDVD